VGPRRTWLAPGVVLAATLLAPAAAAAQGDATMTAVSCTPPSILVGAATSCSATVQDTTPDGSTPGGSLAFSTDTPGGAFENPENGNPATTCPLSAVGEEHAASCRLLYIPGTSGTGVHKITVSYVGDALHDASSGSGNVNVAKHPTTTSITCSPGSLTLGAGTSTCVVAVRDTSAVASTPTGSVVLSSAAGSIGSGCGTLVAAGASEANCTVAFTPAVPGLGSLSGTYGGDSAHAPSDGTAPVNALAPPAPTRAAAAPKKCKKRKKRSATSAKKRCKKKQKK
jgi:hypothetical protein